MFYFGIPLISKKAAVNWEQVVALLHATLTAVAQQTDQRFHCLIACHDIPQVDARYAPFITFLPVDAPIPQNVTEMRRDKGLKKRKIGVHLRQLGGGYLMFLDSDDLVHQDLVKYALETQNSHGYVINTGFEYDSGSGHLTLRKNFNHICGSCAIFRLECEDLPATMEDDDCFYSKLQSHKQFENVCTQHGRPLMPVPFPAVVYLRTADITISTRFFKAKGVRLWKKQLREMLLRKRLTPEIQRSFYLQA